MVGCLEVLKVNQTVSLQAGHLVDCLEVLKVDQTVSLQAGHLVDCLEVLKVDQTVRLKMGHLAAQWGLKILVLLVLEFVLLPLVSPLSHPSPRMLHRASNQVLPLRPVLLLVLQMFSCRPWSSLTKPYLAA
jgi:hypothetical protein